MNSKLTLSTMALCAAFAITEAQAPWSSAYTSPTATGNCSGLDSTLNATNFTIEPIISRTLFTDPQPLRILKMAFWLNPTTHKADILIAEKGGSSVAGRVLYYNASATPNPTLSVIGTIPNVYIGFNESGVWGLAVNPQTFAQDHFLYIIYASGTATTASPTNGWRVSRFKLHPTTRVMDLASEKILMHLPAATSGRWHTGGSMRFDNFGNLYIATGDNEATAMGPGNTADYRGGILRIRPDSTVPKGYTIPAGNFGDYWAQKWQDSGLVTRAAAYRDTAIVKPEIYVKGTRNPYVIGLDPNRLGWMAWSDCGPDRANERAEEHNFTTKPAFSGWPFWVGDGMRQGGYAASYDERPEPTTQAEWNAFSPVGMSTQIPVNNWPQVTGYDTLPPMHVPYTSQTSGCAMGGPIIRYNGSVNNPDKLPPHLDNVVLSHNFTSGAFFGIKIDTATGTTIASARTVLNMTKTSGQPSFRNLVEFAQGPDGVLYGVDWGAGCCNGDRAANNTEGIARIRYTGTCQDPGLVPTGIASERLVSRTVAAAWLRVGSSTFSITAPGAHEASILDVSGRTLKTFRGEGHKTYNIPTIGSGVHVLRVKTSEGMTVRPLAAGL